MNYCVCCGEPIPEGTWVCSKCQKGNADKVFIENGKINVDK